MPLTITGLDPSLTGTATWTLPNHHHHTTKTRGKRTDTRQETHTRILRIRDQTISRIIGQKPDLVVIEGPAYGSRTGNPFDRDGLWWLLYHALAHKGIPVIEVPPTTRAKFATDKGNADKAEVGKHTEWLWGHTLPADDNQIDALVLATIGAVLTGQRLPFPILERHYQAVSLVREKHVGILASIATATARAGVH